MTNPSRRRPLFAFLVCGLALAVLLGAPSDAWGARYEWGEVDVELRYRVEFVSDDAAIFTEDAWASTLRTALIYRSPSWKRLSTYFQFEDVSDLGWEDNHNNGGLDGLNNGVVGRPVIADPEITSVNQVALRYAGIWKGILDVGRREINLGTQRFVGAVGWRQHHQTFETVRFSQTPLDWLSWSYSYVARVHRVFGDSQAMDSHLLDVPMTLLDAGTLTAYFYYLDYDDEVALSTATYGARWEGKVGLGGGWSLPYRAELAQQSDAGDNPDEVDALYYNIEAKGARKNFWVFAGWEVLEGGDGDGRFTTPLATLHKFNGWADKFLVTPANGLEDLYAGVGGKAGRFSFTGVYHDFGANSGGASYGSELDAQAVYTAPWSQKFALKLAAYDADEYLSDTLKAWFWTSFELPRSQEAKTKTD